MYSFRGFLGFFDTCPISNGFGALSQVYVIVGRLSHYVNRSRGLLLENSRQGRFLSLTSIVSGHSTGKGSMYFICVPYVREAKFYASTAMIAFLYVSRRLIILGKSNVFSTNLFTSAAISAYVLFPTSLDYSLSPCVVLLYFRAIILTSNGARFRFVEGLSSRVSLVWFRHGIVTISIST